MKQLKKGLFTLLVGLFGALAVNAQTTNLFENGDFTNGTKGWFLSGFELGNDNGYALVETGYYNEFYPPTIKTEGQTVEGLSGNTYTFSFWAKNLKVENLTVNIKLKDAQDKDLYDSQIGMSRNFKLEVEDDQGDWKKLSKTVTFPSNVAKLTEFRISFGGNDYKYKAVSEISMVKKENPAPKQFKVVEGSLSQRIAQLSWEAMQGKVYKVMVNNKTYTVDSGNMLVVEGLTPNKEYNASIYAEDTPEAKSSVTFTTKNYIKDNEEERVPFLANITDGKIDGKFLYAIEDLTGNEIEDIKVTFNDSSATVEGGYVTLPSNVNKGKLVVEVTQKGGEKTVITYDSITKK